nr:MAG TPA_asm: hypothetical protein [Caudoviricetes sp.]
MSGIAPDRKCRRQAATNQADYGERAEGASSYTEGYLYLRIVIRRDNSLP